MTALEEFYDSYLHYSVAQRLFEDTCRQLRDCKGTLDERQALVDETLRLAMCVTDNVDETEGLIADTIEFIQSEDGDPDLLEAISLISNNLKEDRARANSYSNFITYRRIGNYERKPRKPQIANPFVMMMDDAPVEAIVVPPVEVQPDPEPIYDDGTEPIGASEDASEEPEPIPGNEPEESDPEHPQEEEIGCPETEEASEPENEPADSDPETDDGESNRNPLAVETERLTSKEQDKKPKKKRKGLLGRRRLHD
ncbi:MAG: hypothetical protein E7Z70_01920 [Thermoplasmata archaeon]|nr:hypothetical protein [Thermoplasmata archaeon]